MSTTSTTKNRLTLKLMVDEKRNRVLFAEVDKHVVDFLLSLLLLPVGSLAALPEGQMPGCVANIRSSLASLHHSKLTSPWYHRPALLNPKLPILPTPSLSLLTNNSALASQQPTYYRCTSSCNALSLTKGVQCLLCGKRISTRMWFLDDDVGGVDTEREFVEDTSVYMVTDDLTFSPMTVGSAFVLSAKLGVKDLSSLKEITVELGYNEGVKLLKASMNSSNALTTTFLSKLNISIPPAKRVKKEKN